MGIEKEYETAIFTFVSNSADVILDKITDDYTKQQFQIMKVFKSNSKVKYIYDYGKGLIKIGKDDKRNRIANVLGEFLKTKNSINDYINFFKDYGFLFPLEDDKSSSIVPSQINVIRKRLESTIELINEVNAIDSLNYQKILKLSLYLFLDGKWEIDLGYTTISSHNYSLFKQIDSSIDTIGETVSSQEEVNRKCFTIDDAIYGEFDLPSADYHDIVDGYSKKIGWDDIFFRTLTYLYANKKFENDREKEIISFLFHYYYKVGIPKNTDIDDFEYYSRPNNSEFTEDLKDSLIVLAKYIIKREIDHNIKGVVPTYDEIEMKPKWKIKSLLNAMYFSLFYLDSHKEMYRRCEHCGNYFMIKRTTSTKIYCDQYCRNNAQQAKHRLKIKSLAKKDH